MKSKKSTTQAAKPRTPRGNSRVIADWLIQNSVVSIVDAPHLAVDFVHIARSMFAYILVHSVRGFSDEQIGEQFSEFLPPEKIHELVRIAMGPVTEDAVSYKDNVEVITNRIPEIGDQALATILHDIGMFLKGAMGPTEVLTYTVGNPPPHPL